MEVIKFNKQVSLISSDGRGIYISTKEVICEMFIETDDLAFDLYLDIYTKGYVKVYNYPHSLVVNPGPTQNLKVTKKEIKIFQNFLFKRIF